MSDKLNKLQIRAKILEIIKSYNSEDDFHSDFHVKNIQVIRSFNADDFIIDFLLKELLTAQEFECQVIKYLIMDFAALDKVENAIWEIVRDENVPDRKKEMYLQFLRNLGCKIDTYEISDCFEDFEGIVDEQTLELLELASINPEAKIDFLDFLTSLNPPEQIQLILSLQDDFHGDELCCVITPCLRIKLAQNVKEIIISILASSKSYFAVKPLKLFLEMSVDEKLKKDALKALNQLKNDGLDIDNNNLIESRDKYICAKSTFYKAFLSQVDGCGNQGLIFSRIDDNQQISMFSSVVNATSGIIDCFGLQNISVSDFQKVISRFKANDLVVPISAGQAKYLFLKAEKNNNETSNYLPYEYICWSMYTADIEPEVIDFNLIKTSDIQHYDNNIYNMLYDTEIFDSWFFEYDDIYEIQLLLDYVLELANNDISLIYEKIENKISEIFPKIFSSQKINEFAEMLKQVAFVFKENYSNDIANISINLSEKLNEEQRFLKDVIRRSILQYLASIVADDKEENDNLFAKKTQKIIISEENAFELLNALEEKWDNANV